RLGPLVPPRRVGDEDLVEPARQGVPDAEERLGPTERPLGRADVAGRLRAGRLPGELGHVPQLAVAQEQAAELGLLGLEVRPLAPLEPLLQLQPVPEHLVDLPGDLVLHDALRRFLFRRAVELSETALSSAARRNEIKSPTRPIYSPTPAGRRT